MAKNLKDFAKSGSHYYKFDMQNVRLGYRFT